MSECSAFPEKIQFESEKDAHRHIQRLARRSTYDGLPFANAVYRCETCGEYHLYRRGTQKRPLYLAEGR